jgi:hypothetical protein
MSNQASQTWKGILHSFVFSCVFVCSGMPIGWYVIARSNHTASSHWGTMFLVMGGVIAAEAILHLILYPFAKATASCWDNVVNELEATGCVTRLPGKAHIYLVNSRADQIIRFEGWLHRIQLICSGNEALAATTTAVLCIDPTLRRKHLHLVP